MLKFVKILDPPEILKPYVFFFAVMEDAKTEDASVNYDVIPLGDACIVFATLGWADEERGRSGMSFLLVTGPMSRIMRSMVTPKENLIVRFKAGAFQTIFGIPAHEVKNKVLFMDKFWGKGGKEWAEKLRQAPDTDARMKVFQDELIRRAPTFKPPDPYLTKAIDFMRESGGKITVEELSRRLGYTERQIERKFEDGLGLTPKEYQRVLRCRLVVLRMMNGDFKDWAELVDDYGFADQGHLIRDFKSFMGMAPEKFLARFKGQGRILESPMKGVRDETAIFGYKDDAAIDSRPPVEFIQVDVESIARQTAAFSPKEGTDQAAQQRIRTDRSSKPSAE